MAGGVTLQVRQVGSYPLVGSAGPGDLLLMQPGGLGNPYASVDAAVLVSTALSNFGGPLGVGTVPPTGAYGSDIFAFNYVQRPGGGMLFNAYYTGSSILGLAGGMTGLEHLNPSTGAFEWFQGAGGAGQNAALVETMVLGNAGGLSLPRGTLTVARDPGAALEVATMGYVGNNTVASFNGRKGVVQLTSGDIYGALCLDSAIASQNWVAAAIQASNQYLLANHPFVFGWNGRTGSVYLTLSDITCVFFQPGQQPITQTPPLTSNDYSIPNTAWVVEYIANEFAGGGSTLATQAWVLANTVNSFNGRMGPVTLTSSDVFDVGAAPLNSPQFSGVPTAPTAAIGQATGQIATTAFVQQAISESTAGVASFNTRTGAVVLTTADVTTAGGLTNPSANLTGAPSAPTAPPGTSTPQIANTQFVMAAIAAGTVTSFNTRTGAVTLQLSDVTGVGGAPLASPSLSGTPTAPTAAPGTNTTQLATTQFVSAALAAAGGVSSFNSRTGAVTLEANDVSAVGGLINPNVALTGTPSAPTAAPGTNTTQIANTAFVAAALNGTVTSFNTRTGAVTLVAADITAAGGALLASPAFTGTPTAPTATAGANNTQIATTAFVAAAIAADTTGVTSFNTRVGAVTLLAADISGAGGALLASPALTGIPTAPTATAGTSTTQLATTAFVQAAVGAGAVTSWNSRTGAVTLQANDISAVGGALLASPAFTGTPAVPTAAAGTNTTQAASTAFVASAITAAPFTPNNLVDNSGFLINQRGYAAGTALVAGQYWADRWAAGSGGATLNNSVNGGSFFTNNIAAGSTYQVIEGLNLLTGTYVLSWTGTATGRFYNRGGTPPAYAASPIIVTATAGTDLFIEFTGGTFTRVQLQPGTQPTPWEPENAAEMLLRCQRYYQISTLNLSTYTAAAGTGPSSSEQFVGTMRAAPTVAFNGVGYGPPFNSLALVQTTPQSFIWNIQTSGAGQGFVSANYTASADL